MTAITGYLGHTNGSVLDVFRARAVADPDGVTLRTMDGGCYTWRSWHDASRSFAAALGTLHLEPGSRVAILAGNRPLWPIADVGTLFAGMIAVGIYPTSAPAQVEELLADCDARVIVVDTPEQLDKVIAVRSRLPRLREIIALQGDGSTVTGWDAWLSRGALALQQDPAVAIGLDTVARGNKSTDTALLIYTSGSTGRPKAAKISYECLRASADSVIETLGLTSADSSLSFLPFCHAGERMFGLYTRIVVGMPCLLVTDHHDLWNAARTYEPTLFGGLPRFYEKVSSELRVEERSGADAASRHRTIATFFGNRLRLATSGGAALPIEVAEHLASYGVAVLGAYGSTEHLCTAFHRPGRHGFDSVGWPMPGTEIRIADDGEVRIRRSALTFSGYLNRDAETRDAFTPDGEWLLTGDLGSLSPDGALHITGRKKELIALSNGKKIAPLRIEAALTDGQWISSAMVYGEGKKFLSALLCLGRPAAESWAREHGVIGDFVQLADHPEIRAAVQDVVERANANVNNAERVRRWVLLPHEFSVDGGELTPTLKLRRADIVTRYGSLLDSLYS